MKNIYRFAGASFRHILKPNAPELCFVVEMQHRKTGEIYHYHKDFPLPVKYGAACAVVGFRAMLEVCKIVDGKKIPSGWELQSPVEHN